MTIKSTIVFLKYCAQAPFFFEKLTVYANSPMFLKYSAFFAYLLKNRLIVIILPVYIWYLSLDFIGNICCFIT